VPQPIDPARRHLLGALEADLIGPYDPKTGVEVLSLPPLRWYLTGFLIPEGQAHADATLAGDEDEGMESGDDAGPDEQSAEPDTKQRPRLPSSLGLSVLLPDTDSNTIEVEVAWGEYALRSTKDEIARLCHARGMDVDSYAKRDLWERVAIPPRRVVLDLSQAGGGKLARMAVPDTVGVQLEYRVETISPADAEVLEIGEAGQGAKALSVFLVNTRPIVADPEVNSRGFSRELNGQTLFQVALTLHAPHGLLPRPDAHFSNSQDLDDRMVDLQFRREVEWVVGHGIAARPIARDGQQPLHPTDNPAVGGQAVWLPHARVVRVEATSVASVTVKMRELQAIESAADVEAKLGRLPEIYGEWIAEQAAIPLARTRHQGTQADLVVLMREAKDRIADGIKLLATDPELRQAFCWANQAMADISSRRNNNPDPEWRLFQLAFLLLNLRGLSDPAHADRDKVELLFFPTGGGKTEAYLGVIATTLLLRRMRGVHSPDGGLGVAVILRYTLRLLTLDQLERASALICSLELLRRDHPERLGTVRYSIGLWVGRSGTPNTMADAKKQVTDYRGNTAESKGSPFPLVICPWCGADIEARGMDVLPRRSEPTHTVVICANSECEFSSVRRGKAGTKVGELPVLFVDEHVYSELPSFLVSTVDKFAMLTHRGPAGKLFGRVHSYADQRDGPRRYFGGGDGLEAAPKSAEPLEHGLAPPDLIIQDELHLISGPLGTMVGLFETLVDELCTRELPSGVKVGPKVVAATATVRRASAQVQALYGRTVDQTKLFPPQGVDAWQTFFARRDMDANERMYVGLAAPGRSLKRILLQSYLVLLGAGEQIDVDPYKTLVGYFNSLRELGGMRRIVDDDVYTRVRKPDQRVPQDARVGAPKNRWLAKRETTDPIELTSRVKTAQLTKDKARLAASFHEYAAAKPDAPKPVDVLLASNMISVGLDVTRLGLMVVAGQPKTTSEYIQATSRVGRDDRRPGFVLTVYNVHKPRDRSHYEHFVAYHESFYRYVEAQSVTPFSLPALDRSLASVVVGMVRHSGPPKLAGPRGADELALISAVGDRVGKVLAERAHAQPDALGNTLEQVAQTRSKKILDAWREVVQPTAESAGSSVKYCYSPFEKDTPLLRTPEADATRSDPYASSDPHYPFVAPTSMRDVEPSVAIWIRRRKEDK